MDPARLRALLEQVKEDLVGVEEALDELRTLPFRQLGDTATVDHHRALRVGFPEVILGQGKTAEQIAVIMGELQRAGGNVLATRVEAAQAEAVTVRLPDARYDPEARTLVLEQRPWQ